MGALIIIGVYIVCKQANLSTNRATGITAIFAAGISGFVAENLYGQGSYGAIFCISIYTIYFYIKSEKSSKINKNSIFFALLIILSTWSNPFRAFISYILPLAFAIIHLNFKNNSKEKILKNLVIIGVSVTIGILAHKITMRYVQNTSGVSSALWLAPENMLRNFLLSWKGILSLLGGTPPENFPIISINGLVYAIRLSACIFLIVIIPSQLKKITSTYNYQLQFLACFSLMALGLTAFIMICTTLPDMNDPVQSSRYLVPPILLLVMLNFSVLPKKVGTVKIAIVVCGLIYAFSAPLAYKYSDNSSRPALNDQESRNNRFRLIKFLEENNLHYGYGGYWNSGVISVFSGGIVRVRQILVPDGVPAPSRYLSSNTWYNPNYWDGETFLLLTPPEASTVDWNKLAKMNIVPYKKLEFNGMQIFVFKYNLAKIIPGWEK